jgi:hypothetical protein
MGLARHKALRLDKIVLVCGWVKNLLLVKYTCYMEKVTLTRIVLLLICTFSLLVSFAQSSKISETVKDDKGSPLADGTVSVRDTELVGAINANGIFNIDIPANARVLIISSLAWKKRR